MTPHAMTGLGKDLYGRMTRMAKFGAIDWPPALRYALALIVLAVLLAIRWVLPLQSAPFLIFMPGMVAIAFALGRGPGFVTTLLSAVLIDLFFYAPSGRLTAMPTGQLLGFGLYVVISSGLVIICDLLREALIRRDADLQQTRQAADALAQSRAELEASAAFLGSVLDASPDCVKVLSLDGKLTFMNENGKRIMEVTDFSKIEGCPWPDFWQGEHNAEALAAVAKAQAGETARFQGYAETIAGTPRWWDVVVTPIKGTDGKPAKLLSVSRDMTDIRAVDQQRLRLASLIEQSTDFIGMADVDGQAHFLNDAALRMIGLTRAQVTETKIVDYFCPEDRKTVEETVMPAVAQRGRWEGELRFRNFRTGSDIPVLYNIFPIRDADKALLGYGTVTKDITAQKRAEAQQRLLNHELGHRLKNTLAMVQAIANQTLRRADSVAEARTAFEARLVALGKAQDVLTTTKWESAEIGSIVRSALAPHGGDGERFIITGPSLLLSSRCSLALSLALHELATNAAKYGALSNEAGKVSVAWDIVDAGSAPQIQLQWKERNGPPVRAPERSGFGSFMIERSLAGYFKGTAKIDYPQDGVSFLLKGPATQSETTFMSGDVDILIPQVNFNDQSSV